ncbi:MAG: PDZ domain-containing protein [Planctomycetes bacterium]|nr:PDZ domain-containing protein [Planctomycetota bacterium]
MNEKYMSVWIWLINGIIAITTILVMNNFLINPKSDWTLKINQIPNIRIPSWDIEDIKIPVKGETLIVRTVNDPIWKDIGKLHLNELKLPPIPKPPDPPGPEDDKNVKEPTKAEALADLQQRLILKAIFAPLAAEAQMIETGMEFIIIPYSRDKPDIKDDILLTDEYNIYDDLTEIGLPAKCFRITADGVYFDYNYSNSKFTKEFRLFLPFDDLFPNTLEEFEKKFGDTEYSTSDENASNGSGKTDYNRIKNDRPSIDKKTGNIIISRKEFSDFKNNIDKELTGLGLKSAYNPKTGKSEGLKVTREPKSPMAKKYDVQKGDVIISINNHNVSSISEARAWVKKNDKESIYTVVYKRNGKTLVKSIVPPKN